MPATKTSSDVLQSAIPRQSHAEYVAGCDEEQLENLIEQASARLDVLRTSGWVRLWTVSLGWGNVAWFPESEFAVAADFAQGAVTREAAQALQQGIELELKLKKYRPAEVPELLAETEKLILKLRAPRRDGTVPGCPSKPLESA